MAKCFFLDILVSNFQCISNDPSKSKTLGRGIVELYGNTGGNSYYEKRCINGQHCKVFSEMLFFLNKLYVRTSSSSCSQPTTADVIAECGTMI
jgi:hypothetical protein